MIFYGKLLATQCLGTRKQSWKVADELGEYLAHLHIFACNAVDVVRAIGVAKL